MLRWSDGVMGGLLAGIVSAIFFVVIGQVVVHEARFGEHFVRFAFAILGPKAGSTGPIAFTLGLLLYFIAAVVFGVLYASIAGYFKPMWSFPTSTMCGVIYGLVMFFVVEDVMVPVLHVVSYQPLWEGLVGNIFFHGIVISEYVPMAHRRNLASDSSVDVA